ncbi:MAG: DUF2191 domain-containing protein [Acidobacteriia bacterium]|nr:DUF2191 domain-containing protein [Terriglobia bacterium]
MERTTIRLEDDLLRKAKREAQRRGTTFTALVAEGLRNVLARRESPRRRRVKIPVSTRGGGLRPGVDLNNSAALLDLMEGRD